MVPFDVYPTVVGTESYGKVTVAGDGDFSPVRKA